MSEVDFTFDISRKSVKKIKERTCISEDIIGTIDDVIQRLQSYKEEYGDSAYLEYEFWGYDGGKDLYLFHYRDETPAETERRLKQEEKADMIKKRNAARIKERELKELNRLMKKYKKETNQKK